MPLLLAVLATLLPQARGIAATVPDIDLGIHEMRLDNGMTLLLVPRPDAVDVAAGWVVGSGSAADPAGRRGLAHMLEHLMFKGSRTLGTSDYEEEATLRARLDAIEPEFDRLRNAGKGGGKRARRLAQEAEAARNRLRSLLRLGEFSLRYSEAGASGLNGFTFEDFTLYFVRLPAHKLELWFWMESDRLLDPVFREVEKERDIIRQEIGRRVESTPAGRADAELRAAFWGSSPYAWRALGGAEDVATLTRSEAEAFFARHYAAPNLTAVLVGRFDLEEARRWAMRYLGRLPAVPAPESAAAAPSVDWQHPDPAAIDAFEASCDCPPQAKILYPTVPFRHADSYALQALAGVLNGRTGRLHRSLVLAQEIAFSASASQIPYRGAGHFEIAIEAKGGTPPEDLVTAWDRELSLLAATPVSEAELGKVKNQMIASSLRRLRQPANLARQLLVYAGLGDWRNIDDRPRRLAAVTAEEVREVARTYLRGDRRLVAHYRSTQP